MIDEIVILLAVLVRAIGLNASSIWYDEAYSLALSRLPLLEIARLQAIDFNPPLWELLIAPVTPHFGLIGARVLSLILFIGCMLVLRQILVDLQTSNAVRLMILISAGAMPGMIWAAQDARPYMLLTFLFLLAVQFIMNNQWNCATACMGLMIYTHAVAPFLILGVLAVGIYLYIGLPETRKSALIAVGVVVFCNLTWPYSLMRSGDFWLDPINIWSTMYSWYGVIFAWDIPALLGLLIVGLMAMVSIPILIETIGGMIRYDGDFGASIFCLMTVVPFAGMVAFSLISNNIIFYRPLIPLAIPLVAWLIIALVPRRMDLLANLTAVLLVATLILSVIPFDAAVRGGHLDEGAQYIAEHWQPGDQIYYSDGAIALPMDQYLHDHPHHLIAFSNTHRALGNPIIMRALGLPSESFTNTSARTWLVWHREDRLLGEDGVRTLSHFALGGIRVMTLTSPQFASVEIYLIPFDRAVR